MRRNLYARLESSERAGLLASDFNDEWLALVTLVFRVGSCPHPATVG